jgi:hypothetical protein
MCYRDCLHEKKSDKTLLSGLAKNVQLKNAMTPQIREFLDRKDRIFENAVSYRSGFITSSLFQKVLRESVFFTSAFTGEKLPHNTIGILLTAVIQDSIVYLCFLQHYSLALNPMGSIFEVASIFAWYQWQ